MNETLVSSECVYIHAFNKLLNRYNFQSVQKKYMDFIHDFSCKEVIEAWFGQKMEKQIHEEYELYYIASSYNHLTIINNSLNFIKKCHNLNIKQAIITNKPNFVAIPELERLGFYKYVDTIIDANKCAKTSNELLNLIIKNLHIKVEKDFIQNPINLWIFGNSQQELNLSKKYNAKFFSCQKLDINNEKNTIYTTNFNEIEFYDA